MIGGLFTFNDAATLAGITEKALRGWLDRDQVRYPGLVDREQNTWRRFTLVDVFHLALVGTIIKYDFRIEFANRAASEITDRFKPGSELDLHARLVAWEHLDEFTLRLRHPDSFGDDAADGSEIISADVSEKCGAYLLVRPDQVWREVRNRYINSRTKEHELVLTLMRNLAEEAVSETVPNSTRAHQHKVRSFTRKLKPRPPSKPKTPNRPRKPKVVRDA